MRRTRWLVVSLMALSVTLAHPSIALAHAGMVSSTPEPGSELGTAPGVVVLRFTEPLNVRLSRASVTTPSQQDRSMKVRQAALEALKVMG